MAAISKKIISGAYCVNEKFCIFIKISLKFVPKVPVDNNPALVQIMACSVHHNSRPIVPDGLLWLTDK